MEKEKIMSTNKIVKRTVASFYIMALMVLIVACDTGNGMMHGNNSMGMNNLNWTQILIGLGVVCLIAFIIWVVISKRK
jgi:uncharacterized membrane protein YqjE